MFFVRIFFFFKVLRAILLVHLMVEVMHQCVLSCPGLLDSFKLKIEKYNFFKLPAPLRGRYTWATGHQLICFLLRRIGWGVLLKEGGSGKGGGGTWFSRPLGKQPGGWQIPPPLCLGQ